MPPKCPSENSPPRKPFTGFPLSFNDIPKPWHDSTVSCNLAPVSGAICGYASPGSFFHLSFLHFRVFIRSALKNLAVTTLHSHPFAPTNYSSSFLVEMKYCQATEVFPDIPDIYFQCSGFIMLTSLIVTCLTSVFPGKWYEDGHFMSCFLQFHQYLNTLLSTESIKCSINICWINTFKLQGKSKTMRYFTSANR